MINLCAYRITLLQWPPLNRDTDKGEHLLIGTVFQTPINFLLMLVYVNVSSDKGEHLLIGIKFMLPDYPVYQVCTVSTKQQILMGTFFQSVYFQCFLLHCILTFPPKVVLSLKVQCLFSYFPPCQIKNTVHSNNSFLT